MRSWLYFGWIGILGGLFLGTPLNALPSLGDIDPGNLAACMLRLEVLDILGIDRERLGWVFEGVPAIATESAPFTGESELARKALRTLLDGLDEGRRAELAGALDELPVAPTAYLVSTDEMPAALNPWVAAIERYLRARNLSHRALVTTDGDLVFVLKPRTPGNPLAEYAHAVHARYGSDVGVSLRILISEARATSLDTWTDTLRISPTCLFTEHATRDERHEEFQAHVRALAKRGIASPLNGTYEFGADSRLRGPRGRRRGFAADDFAATYHHAFLTVGEIDTRLRADPTAPVAELALEAQADFTLVRDLSRVMSASGRDREFINALRAPIPILAAPEPGTGVQIYRNRRGIYVFHFRAPVGGWSGDFDVFDARAVEAQDTDTLASFARTRTAFQLRGLRKIAEFFAVEADYFNASLEKMRVARTYPSSAIRNMWERMHSDLEMLEPFLPPLAP